MKKNKAFTLIELIAVLVIMAILALIVTPLVMSIIKKAKISADKRSIDAYGRSIELAIAGYLLDNGYFPTDIGELTIEYRGDEVVCATTQLNSDSSVYLANCTVGGRSVDGYTYGKEEALTYAAYEIGDIIEYKGINFYVIKNSDSSESTVTLLKAEPLTVEEVNTYGGVGTANNHVNMYATSNADSPYYQKAYNKNGYGGMQYYSSETCIYSGDISGCTTEYNKSEVKYVVDAWVIANIPSTDLMEDSIGYKARILSIDDFNQLGYELFDNGSAACWNKTSETPNFIYNSNYDYWTISAYGESKTELWTVYNNGTIYGLHVMLNGYGGVVRPVITISKSVL